MTATRDDLGGYLDAIGRRRLLSADEEQALARRMEAGRKLADAHRNGESLDEGQLAVLADARAARALFVEANLRLVVSVAAKLRGRELTLDDLIQEGNAALIEAVETFDWRRGWRFSTYAVWGIRRAMVRADHNTGRCVRLPSHVHDRMSAVAQTRRGLEAASGRPATDLEVADASGMSVETLVALRAWSRRPRSLAEPMGSDGERLLGDMMFDAAADLAFESAEVRASVPITELPERERTVLEMRFGLAGHVPHSLAQIASVLGLSRERVRNIETVALQRLRTRLGIDPEASDRTDRLGSRSSTHPVCDIPSMTSHL